MARPLADTLEFAVAALARWWEEEGQVNYLQAKQWLILADAGGSHGCRPRSFKQQLQEELSDRSWTRGGRLPLSDGMLDMEPSRASLVQPDQSDVGRQATTQF